MSKYYCMRKVPSPRCLLFLGIFCVARCSEMECNHRSSCIIYNQADDCVHFKARSTFKGLSHEAQAHGRTRAQPVARAADAGGYILISRTTTQFLNVGVSRQRKKKDLDNRGTITKLFLAALLAAVIATCKAASQKVWNSMKNERVPTVVYYSNMQTDVGD